MLTVPKNQRDHLWTSVVSHTLTACYSAHANGPDLAVAHMLTSWMPLADELFGVLEISYFLDTYKIEVAWKQKHI